MKISCGMVVLNPQATAILGCKAYGRTDNLLDLPKGMREPKESYIDTAWRELLEETGLTELQVEVLCYDPHLFTYTNGKKLALFPAQMREDYDLSKLKCSSCFQTPTGESKPEMVGYEWVLLEDIDTRFYPKLTKPLLTLFEPCGTVIDR